MSEDPGMGTDQRTHSVRAGRIPAAVIDAYKSAH